MPLMYKDGNSRMIDSWLIGKMNNLGWSTTPPRDLSSMDRKIILPSPSSALPASYWRGQRRQIEDAIPDFIRRVEAGQGGGPLGTKVGAAGFRSLTVEFVRFGNDGQPEYELRIGDAVGSSFLTGFLGGFTRNVLATLPSDSDAFVVPEFGVEASGQIIRELNFDNNTDLFGPTRAALKVITPSILGSAIANASVQDILGQFRRGEFEEKAATGFGRDEAIEKIAATTNLTETTVGNFWNDLIRGTLPPGAGEAASELPVDATTQMILDFLASLGETAGRGGGSARPRYNPPDPNLVTDWVEGQLQTLVGDIDASRSAQLRDLYLRADRQQFDGQAVDPRQQVLDRIRSYGDYQTIHRLRPDSVKEAEWIPSQVGGLIQAGVRSAIVDQRAVQQATAGVTPEGAGEAANISGLLATGRPLPNFFQRLQRVTTSTFRSVR